MMYVCHQKQEGGGGEEEKKNNLLFVFFVFNASDPELTGKRAIEEKKRTDTDTLPAFSSLFFSIAIYCLYIS